MSTAKRKGLLLTLGGAPNTPHVIAGLPGYFSPTVPHIVGEGRDLSVETATRLAKEHDLKLVDVSQAEAEAAEEQHRAFVAEGRGALHQARQDERAKDDPSRTRDEHDAITED